MMSSVQMSGARPPEAALQQTPSGAPPEPLQIRRGLPSAAALTRASCTLSNQGICWKRSSPSCGLIMALSLAKPAGVSQGSSLPGDSLADTFLTDRLLAG